METVKLKNGSEEAKSLVGIVWYSFCKLADEKPLIAYDLVMRCRDKNYKMFGDAENYCWQLRLVNAAGTIHESIRNIILSAAEGEGMDMIFVHPVARTEKEMNNG